MILTKLLVIALLTTLLGLGIASKSYGNEKNTGTGGGIGGTGNTETNIDLLVNMTNIATVPCDKKNSIGSIATAQGSAIKFKPQQLICEGFEIKTEKDEFLTVDLIGGAKLYIPSNSDLVIAPAQTEVAKLENTSIRLSKGKIRVQIKDFEAGSKTLNIVTGNSAIELSGPDAEIILKPTTDVKYVTYVRSYVGASWISLGNKKVVIPMGYIGFSNENPENPIIEVRKDTGQLGARIPQYQP
ncbi:MAG: hypothetical protein B7Y67_05175 [Polynucleobacter sp. 35-46-11]|jgi:hypothetical protein|uniref:FecR domain-containing protein n=2 Tax=unclassified Polynucleobacter TaxID=2640945 RepID=UPI000BCEEB48|nr:FecR domain-containing protein [Polynucleobacter sp. 35-46-11]OYY20571.1 MAG: hypothetical protein B7Y67_05175 [Polynucleobacter sp. 35-46-11]